MRSAAGQMATGDTTVGSRSCSCFSESRAIRPVHSFARVKAKPGQAWFERQEGIGAVFLVRLAAQMGRHSGRQSSFALNRSREDTSTGVTTIATIAWANSMFTTLAQAKPHNRLTKVTTFCQNFSPSPLGGSSLQLPFQSIQLSNAALKECQDPWRV